MMFQLAKGRDCGKSETEVTYENENIYNKKRKKVLLSERKLRIKR